MGEHSIASFFIFKKGDSGSPLLASEFLPNGEVTEDNSKQWFLMGIVSYGSSYCGKGRPAVHTR